MAVYPTAELSPAQPRHHPACINEDVVRCSALSSALQLPLDVRRCEGGCSPWPCPLKGELRFAERFSNSSCGAFSC